MNPFNGAFRDQATSRHVELIPLLDIVLPDGSTGYLSDRRLILDVGNPSPRIYVRKLISWSGIHQNIDGSSGTATFEISNIDRVMEAAVRDHPFYRGQVTFSFYAPGAGATFSFNNSTRVFWKGYISETEYDSQKCTLTCKDGFFALTLPIPRRRATRNCNNQFDDGCHCPYSGYGYKGAGIPPYDEHGIGHLIQIEEKIGVVGPSGETHSAGTHIPGRLGDDRGDSDFGPDIDTSNANISKREGYAWGLPDPNSPGSLLASGAGYTECPKTLEGCYLRGMLRFFTGLRYVASWSTSRQPGLFGSFKRPNYSISAVNDSVYNQVYPMVYTNVDEFGLGAITLQYPLHGFIMEPLMYEWRPEQQFFAAEFFISLGRMGVADDGMAHLEISAINDIFVNGKGPHGVHVSNIPDDAPHQYPDPNNPKTWGFGVARSAGRVGEPQTWDEIGGLLLQSDRWINPVTGDQEVPPAPLFFSRVAGGFCRIFDLNAGNNNPQAGYSSGTNSGQYSSGNSPDVKVALNYGRWVWQYLNNGSRFYGPSSSPAWVILDAFLDTMDSKYNNSASSEKMFDRLTFKQTADYSNESVKNVVNPTLEAPRYLWSGKIDEAKSAQDHLDNLLRDFYGYRFFRNGKFAILPKTSCQFDTKPRPAFQEFVNTVMNSSDQGESEGNTKVSQPQPEFNEYNLTYGDVDFDFQKNTATIYSEAHQLLVGQDGNRYQLTKSDTLVGTPTTDQATRIGLRTLKDELGGVDLVDWTRKHEVKLKGSLMLSELEVGDVTYLADTLVPDGGGWFRVTEWQLNDDYTIDYTLQTFNIGNYDDLPTGASSVSLAGFGYNPYIPGSGGLAFTALPPIDWDRDTPLVSYPIVGNKLKWMDYENPPHEDFKELNARKLSVQIYRTPAVVLIEDVNETSVTWPVLNGDIFKNDIYSNLPTTAIIGGEQILINSFNLSASPPTMGVTRAQNGTTGIPHAAGEKAAKILYVGGFLAQHITSSATEWVVGSTPFDFRVGEKYFVDAEVVKCSAVVPPVNPGDPSVIHVIRGQKTNDNNPNEFHTFPTPHRKLKAIVSVYYLDKIPNPLTTQGATLMHNEYVDPWEPSTPQRMPVESDGTSSVGARLTIVNLVFTGNVDVNLNIVNWLNGDLFDGPAMNGHPIWINGVQYTVSLVVSPSSLLLSTPAGHQIGVGYHT